MRATESYISFSSPKSLEMGKWLACYLRVKLVKFMFRGCYYSCGSKTRRSINVRLNGLELSKTLHY